VANAVNDWLSYGLNGRDQATIGTCAILRKTHIIPCLGARKLRDLSAEDVERWLANKATPLTYGVESVKSDGVMVVRADVRIGQLPRGSQAGTGRRAGQSLMSSGSWTKLFRSSRGVGLGQFRCDT
jgi:hypothetical protein